MNDRDEAETALYQSDREAYNSSFRETYDRQFEALIDRTFGRQTQEEFEADLDTIRIALKEATTEEAKDIGDLATGAWDNTVDLSNIWAMYPQRRREYSMKQIQIMLDTLGLLRELIEEITKQEAA